MVLKPTAFQACFTDWLQSLRTEATAETSVEQPVLAVDGKTLRRSHDRAKEQAGNKFPVSLHV